MTTSYYEWLVNQVGNELEYSELLTLLYSREFYFINKRDQNRKADGLYLRDSYIYQEEGSLEDVPEYCTCLEMLIALAKRIEDSVMWDPDEGDRTSNWFWMMIENLGLKKYTDENFDEEEVNYILFRWLNREYGKDGKPFNIFFTDKKDVNFRRSEIWYQMNKYIIEFLDDENCV